MRHRFGTIDRECPALARVSRIGYSPAIRRCYGVVMRLALYQPDIPQNTGSLIRLGACLGVPVDVIEPCGFPFSARDLRRVALDYVELADVVRHSSFEAFLERTTDRR